MVKAAQAWKKSDPEEVLGGRDEVRSGPKKLKLEAGSNGKFKSTLVRILPPRADAPRSRWYIWVRAHYNVGQNNRVVRCLTDIEQFCPVCAEVANLKREGLEAEADEMRAKTYGVVNLVVLNKETGKPEGGVQVWTPSPPTLSQLINLIEEEYPDETGIDDPEEGRVITIRRTGSKVRDTKYEFRVAPQSTAFNGGDFELLNEMYDLETVYPSLEETKLVALISAGPMAALPAGRDPFGDDDDEVVEGDFTPVEEAPAPARQAKATPAPAVTKANRNAAQDAARARLKAELAAATGADEDEDTGDEDEE